MYKDTYEQCQKVQGKIEFFLTKARKTESLLHALRTILKGFDLDLSPEEVQSVLKGVEELLVGYDTSMAQFRTFPIDLETLDFNTILNQLRVVSTKDIESFLQDQA